MPLVRVLNQEGTAPWHLGVPALAQTTLMGRVLKGELPGLAETLPWWSEQRAPAGLELPLRDVCLPEVSARKIQGGRQAADGE
jgi:hypothetical protein